MLYLQQVNPCYCKPKKFKSSPPYNSMTSITFYGGLREIGGNKFLLKDEKTNLFLDFGKNFAKEKLFFEDPYIMARDEKHLLNLGILPPVPGLYKNDQSSCTLDGILISHPHLDHYDGIRFCKDDFPIFCGEDTQCTILAREFSSQSIASQYNIANMTARNGKQIFKHFNTFQSGQHSTIGDISFQAYALDHSVPGAYGFILETKAGTMVYTGDFRLHGTHKENTQTFLEKAQEAEPEVLLIEGTHVNECKLESEDEVKEKVGKITACTQNLVLAGFAVADMDRIKTFYEVAKAHDRKLAVSAKQAYIIDSLCSQEHLGLFSLHDPHVIIFQRDKKRYSQYEKELQQKYSNIVQATEISHMQEEVILVASLYDMNEVAEIKPSPGSSYILSQSEPFNEEMEISHDKLANWLSYLGIPLYQAHASGHAGPHELKDAITQISPKKVIPVHTERPELFKGFIADLDVEIVMPGEAVEVIL